jgi:hypothetical protein
LARHHTSKRRVRVQIIPREFRDLTLGQCWLNTGLWLSGLTGIAFLSTDNPQVAGLFFAIFFCLASISLALLALG